jgi:hypothetical protein
MRRLAGLLVTLAVAALAGCGGGTGTTGATARAPSRSKIIKCVNHGGGVSQQEVQAEIGALPAHDEIETPGLPEGGPGVLEEGDLPGAVITVDLFGTASEGKEAAEMLTEEEPTAEVHSYAGGAAVSVIARVENEGSTVTSAPKDRQLVAKCLGA